MPKRQEDYIGSFDVSKRRIKVALAEASRNKIQLLSYADRELFPWSEENEPLSDILEELLSRSETMAKIKNSDYRGFPVSINSSEAFYKIKEITIPTGGTVVVDQQLLHQIEREAIESFESNSADGRMIADYIIGYKINGDFYSDVLGKEVDMLNVIIGAVYLPYNTINQIEDSLDILQIEDYVFEYSPISSSFFIPYEEKKQGCFQIHGDWQEFDVLYWYMDKLFSFKKLKYGMRMLSKDVEKVFKISRDVSENLIFKEFKSIKEEDISEGVISVTLKNGDNSEISRQFFQRVIEARADEIAEQLQEIVKDAPQKLSKEFGLVAGKNKIYLTGDFISLNGFKELLSVYFKDSNLVVPSVDNAKTLIIGENKVIKDPSNLQLFGNLINYSNEILIKSQSNKKDKKVFAFFKKRRRQ